MNMSFLGRFVTSAASVTCSVIRVHYLLFSCVSRVHARDLSATCTNWFDYAKAITVNCLNVVLWCCKLLFQLPSRAWVSETNLTRSIFYSALNAEIWDLRDGTNCIRAPPDSAATCAPPTAVTCIDFYLACIPSPWNLLDLTERSGQNINSWL